MGCVAGWKGPGKQSSLAFLQNQVLDLHSPGESGDANRGVVRGVLPLQLRGKELNRCAVIKKRQDMIWNLSASSVTWRFSEWKIRRLPDPGSGRRDHSTVAVRQQSGWWWLTAARYDWWSTHSKQSDRIKAHLLSVSQLSRFCLLRETSYPGSSCCSPSRPVQVRTHIHTCCYLLIGVQQRGQKLSWTIKRSIQNTSLCVYEISSFHFVSFSSLSMCFCSSPVSWITSCSLFLKP